MSKICGYFDKKKIYKTPKNPDSTNTPLSDGIFAPDIHKRLINKQIKIQEGLRWAIKSWAEKTTNGNRYKMPPLSLFIATPIENFESVRNFFLDSIFKKRPPSTDSQDLDYFDLSLECKEWRDRLFKQLNKFPKSIVFIKALNKDVTTYENFERLLKPLDSNGFITGNENSQPTTLSFFIILSNVQVEEKENLNENELKEHVMDAAFSEKGVWPREYNDGDIDNFDEMMGRIKHAISL
jgi:hypothetical protein